MPVAALLEGRAQDRKKIDDERRYIKDLVAVVKDVVFRTNADGRYTFLNPAIEAMIGLRVENCIGKNIDDFAIE